MKVDTLWTRQYFTSYREPKLEVSGLSREIPAREEGEP